MKTKLPNLPSAFEVSQLAIALYGKVAEKRPFHAVRAVMEIWLTAAFELGCADGEDWYGCASQFRLPPEGSSFPLDGRVYDAVWNFEKQKSNACSFGMLRLFVPEDLSDPDDPVAKSSPAMSHVNAWCCQTPSSRFKSIHMFRKAWRKFKPDCNFEESEVHVSELAKFMEIRKKQQLALDATRKRRDRARAGKKQVPVKKSQKIGGGRIQHKKKTKA